MPRKASGLTKIDRIIKVQANGDRYVYERQSQYLPEKKYNKVISTTLLGKMKPESDDKYDLLPTRPKSVPAKQLNTPVKAVRVRIGMIAIAKHIAVVSKIKSELTEVFKDAEGIAMKVETMAWYSFCTDGDTWPGILSFCVKYGAALPYFCAQWGQRT